MNICKVKIIIQIFRVYCFMLKVTHLLYQKNYDDTLILIRIKNKTDEIKHIRFIFLFHGE